MNMDMGRHFDYRRLLRFVLPSIAMMLFTSTYSIVDGFFVSNFAGKEALAAVNLVYPICMIVGAVGFMFGTGGSALVAKTLGEGNQERARGLFTGIVIAAAVFGVVLSVVGMFFIKPVMYLIGADKSVIDLCLVYGYIMMAGMPFFILQNTFQSFFVAAGKPNMGLYATLAAGVTNIVGDALLVGVFGTGIAGAAIATALAEVVGAAFALAFFARTKTSQLRFARPQLELRSLGQTCLNGCSELVGNIAAAVVSTLYNYQLIVYAGTDGVAAYGTIMYVNFVFAAIFFGYAMGSAPLVSFNYGAHRKQELQSLLRKSLTLIACAAVVMFVLSQSCAGPLAGLFVGYDPNLYAMTVRGFRLYDFVFLFMGFGVYASSFFTALNNGVVSAIISFVRTLILETSSVMLMPLVLGLDGIWISAAVAEVLAVGLAAVFLVGLRKEYGYWPSKKAIADAAPVDYNP